jgi:hypothetical protein
LTAWLGLVLGRLGLCWGFCVAGVLRASQGKGGVFDPSGSLLVHTRKSGLAANFGFLWGLAHGVPAGRVWGLSGMRHVFFCRLG